MHLYDGRVGEFIPHTTSGQIADAVNCNSLTEFDPRAAESEARSWRNSLGEWCEPLENRGLIGDVKNSYYYFQNAETRRHVESLLEGKSDKLPTKQ